MRTRLSGPNSLLTGKLTGNFAESGLQRRISRKFNEAESMGYSKIPYATEQGIFEGIAGKIFSGTGNGRDDIRQASWPAVWIAKFSSRYLRGPPGEDDAIVQVVIRRGGREGTGPAVDTRRRMQLWSSRSRGVR